MLRQVQSTRSCKPEARYTISPRQACWNTALGLDGTATAEKNRQPLMQMEKKIHCFPKGHCVLSTAHPAQQQTQGFCARGSWDPAQWQQALNRSLA